MAGTFPPRLPDQPIFYPVTNEGYAAQIARDWNTKVGSKKGFVTRFDVDVAYVAKFERRIVGGRQHEELWVPAEDCQQDKMSGFVYMMSDKPRGVIYTGVTSDLQNRVWEHRNEIHEGFTERYKAKNLVWFESHPNIVLAIQREKSLKRYLREWKMRLIEEFDPTWLDLFERVYELENVYKPHPGTRQWDNYN